MRRRDFLTTGGLALGAAACSAFYTPKPAQPNIIVILLDTTRADALGCYGYHRPTSPNIDSFARSALRCTRAWSTAPWTLPAHASLFTGLPSIAHGTTQEHIYMSKTLPTLAELLAGAGYECTAVIENPMIIRERGYARGFHRYRETVRETRPEKPLSLGLELFREDLAERDRAKPWFFFINLIEPHSPYTAPEEFREALGCDPDSRIRDNFYIPHYLGKKVITQEELAGMRLEYDAEIRWADAIVGEILDALDHAGVLNDSLVIITADHGEHFGEHGHVHHAYSIYEELIHIPMLVRFPGHYPQGESTDLPVQISDLFATALSTAGVKHNVAGSVSIARLFEEQVRRPLVAEYYRPIQVLHSFPEPDRKNDLLKRYFHRMRAIYDGPFKLIWRETGSHELFNLEADPAESVNLADRPEHAADLARLQTQLADWVAAHGGEPPDAADVAEESLDPEIIESLRNLGYLPGG